MTFIIHQNYIPNVIKIDNRYSIYISYLESYPKDAFDSLSSYNTEDKENKENINNNNISNKNKVTIRVLRPSRVESVNLKRIQITNAKEALKFIQTGNLKRSKAHTQLNTNSSQSHALFELELFDGDIIKLKLYIVDLAGSETGKRSGFGYNDTHFNESSDINQSLTVLHLHRESIQNIHRNSL